jgi:hypothetical protein
MTAVNDATTEHGQPDAGQAYRYRVVTASGAPRGEPIAAAADEDALDVVRARRRAGNLPLAPFRLESPDGRVVGSWQQAADVR